MGDALRTIRVLTNDESLMASTRAAVGGLEGAGFEGWGVVQIPSEDDLVAQPPAPGDVLLLDSWSRGRNVYELARALSGRTRCRTYVVIEQRNGLAEPIARFCGATGVLERPIKRSALAAALQGIPEPRGPLPADGRGQDQACHLPEALLVDLATGERDEHLVRALVDPTTGLFNYAFLNYKLDEEFKRAKRFDHPLACVMLGFEGQAGEGVLRELAGIFLESSRDTDVLGRFDESSFLFLLPNTGLDGAAIMANRVAQSAEERGLLDLVGDRLALAVGISHYPNPDIEERAELYGHARAAFQEALADGGGVVVCQ